MSYYVPYLISVLPKFASFFRDVEKRIILTGDHFVRDVNCKNCQYKLGWMYQFASESIKRCKEVKMMLENAFVTKRNTIEKEHFIRQSERNSCLLF